MSSLRDVTTELGVRMRWTTRDAMSSSLVRYAAVARSR